MIWIKRSIALALSIIMLVSVGVLSTSADRQTDLQSQINKLEKQSKDLEAQIKKLKGENAGQQKIADALQAKINNTESQIRVCNNEIYKINEKIAANKAEINKQNGEIESVKLTFKKRLRAIYMNNTDSSAQILLGADNFANFLQLEQLTSSVTSHDKALIDDIVGVIKSLEEKQAENEQLLREQISIKDTVTKKQNQLESEQSEVQKVINSLNSQTNNLNNQNKNIEAQLKKAQRELDNYFASLGTNSNIHYDGNGFYWPVPSYRGWTTYSGHTGIDIPGSYGAPIVASASGTVITVTTGHNRNPGSTGLASYGNYVVIDHGNKDGVNYKTYYAHMSSVAVSNGQSVKQGQVIGYIGNSGNTWGATGTHLHFELRVNNGYRNPINYLRR